MPRREPLNPFLALAITLLVSGVLATLLFASRPSSLWPSPPGVWFGAGSGGGVRFDRPVR